MYQFKSSENNAVWIDPVCCDDKIYVLDLWTCWCIHSITKLSAVLEPIHLGIKKRGQKTLFLLDQDWWECFFSSCKDRKENMTMEELFSIISRTIRTFVSKGWKIQLWSTLNFFFLSEWSIQPKSFILLCSCSRVDCWRCGTLRQNG